MGDNYVCTDSQGVWILTINKLKSVYYVLLCTVKQAQHEAETQTPLFRNNNFRTFDSQTNNRSAYCWTELFKVKIIQNKYTLWMKCTIFYTKSGDIYSKYCALEG
jgi:hypothetical protein